MKHIRDEPSGSTPSSESMKYRAGLVRLDDESIELVIFRHPYPHASKAAQLVLGKMGSIGYERRRGQESLRLEWRG